ncbi:thermonuclease family protein [Heliorestis acidaminivorans]|uniref:Thermonuclease family protein n=1 Tax=Heliorestis acidaminivorans TaxID=553427 RepID=A0A6I0EXY5_9FIRM|nr:thermonuclease family protein [Heliorestis acidaminivorans]
MKNILFFLFIAFILTGCTFLDTSVEESSNLVIVERVVDGDTIIANGQRVRLIGVDTPETVKPNHPAEPYGQEASNFTKKMLEGKRVQLQADVADQDQYGRLLRYVYLEDGTFFNDLLVREGYAMVYTVPPNVAHQETFLASQRYAMENNKGLWGLPETRSDLDRLYVDEKGEGLIKVSRNGIYHLPGTTYYERTNAVELYKTEREALDAGYRKSSSR